MVAFSMYYSHLTSSHLTSSCPVTHKVQVHSLHLGSLHMYWLHSKSSIHFKLFLFPVLPHVMHVALGQVKWISFITIT